MKTKPPTRKLTPAEMSFIEKEMPELTPAFDHVRSAAPVQAQPNVDPEAQNCDDCGKPKSEHAQAQHSPLPWKVSDSKPPKIIIAGRPGFIATLGYPDEGDREANAAYIVRACNEYESLKVKLQVTNATVDHYEKRQLELIKEAGDTKAHAQRLADALRDCETSDGATAFVHPKYAPQRLRAINEIVRAALAQWSKQK